MTIGIQICGARAVVLFLAAQYVVAYMAGGMPGLASVLRTIPAIYLLPISRCRPATVGFIANAAGSI